MNNIEDENLNTYIIPLNYNVPGKWHNISIPNLIEGAILAAIVDIPILSIPFTFQFKFILLILCSTGLVAFALVGINGERISSFMLVALKYLLKLLSQKTVYHMRKVGVQSIETSQNRNTGNTSRAEKLISKLRQIKSPQTKRAVVKSKAENYVQDWLPFEKIIYSAGLIKLKDGRYIKILEIDPQNFDLKKSKDKNSIIAEFQKWINISPFSFQIKVITERTDTSSMFERLNQKTQMESDEKVLAAKKDYTTLVKSIASKEASGKRFFLIIEYEGDPYDNYKSSSKESKIITDMNNAIDIISRKFNEIGNPIIKHESETLFLEDFLYHFICKRSSRENTLKQRKDRLIRDMRFVQSMRYPNDISLASQIPQLPLSSVIAPKGMNFSTPTYCVVDGICYTFLFIRNNSYPRNVYANWTSCLNFGEGVDIDFFFEKLDREKTVTNLGRVLARKGGDLQDSRENERYEVEEVIRAGSEIQNHMRAGEDLFMGVTMITIWDYDLQSMRQKRGRVINILKSNQIKVLPALTECEEAFKMTLPILYINKHLFTKFERNFLSSSLSSIYPFNELRLHDEDGFVLGLCGESIAVYNNFDSKRYINANIGIFGPSGSGKTYLNLTLARRLRLNDVSVLFILPLKGYEYREAVEDINGVFIDLSPGSGICLNIMEIHAEAEIDKAILADAEVTRRSKLQNQITQIITFLQLLLRDDKLSATQESELDSTLSELYSDFGITHDNLSLYDANGKIKTMPTIQDLYDRCTKNPKLESIVSILYPFVSPQGNCRNMNGQTNLDLKNRVIAFDVSNAGDRLLPAFMYLALVFCYDKIKENTHDKYTIFLDEAWKFMINEMAESYVNELIKIVRGYAGSVVFSTQNMADVIKGEYGESILDNCAAKFLLKAGEKEASIFQSLFNLNDTEIKSIMKQQKGEITLLANREKIPILTKTSSREHVLYTTDPNERKKLKEHGTLA